MKKIIEQGDAYLLQGNIVGRNRRLSVLIKLLTSRSITYGINTSKRRINIKRIRTGRAVGTHIVNLYSNGISKLISINDVNKLKKDVEDDPIIKDSMADIGALLVGTFGKLLSLQC